MSMPTLKAAERLTLLALYLVLGTIGCVSDALVATSDQAGGEIRSQAEQPAPPTAAAPTPPSAAPAPAVVSAISIGPTERLSFDNAVIGDIDHDGFDDFVISVEPALPQAPNAAPRVGPSAFYLFYGRAHFAPQLSTADADATFLGEQAAVVGLGDINGDGADDIALIRLDSVQLVYGSPARLHGEYDPATLGVSWTNDAPPPELAHMGFSIGANPAGDVNGDGLGDMWVLTVKFDLAQYPPGSGRKFLVLGRSAPFTPGRFDSSLAIAEFATPPALDPTVGGMELSTAPIDTGDFDGDGYGDLLVPSSQTEEQIFYGGPNKLTALLDAAHADATLTIAGATVMPVHAIGDVDGDGRDDLGTSDDGTRRGIVYGTQQRWSGSVTLTADLSIEPDATADPFVGAGIGAVVASDVDGDGHPDLIAAQNGGYDTNHPGAIYVVSGNGQRQAGSIRLSAGQIVKQGTLTARTTDRGIAFTDSDGLGSSISLGDVDGDGSVDVLASAPGTAVPGALPSWSGGTVYLLPGALTPQ